MFPIVTIGYMGNNIYPARAGEVLRAVILKQREGVPVSASLATVIVERIFDGVVMLGFVFVNLPELARLTQDSGLIGTMDIRTLALVGSAGLLWRAAAFPAGGHVSHSVTERHARPRPAALPARFRDKVRGMSPCAFSPGWNRCAPRVGSPDDLLHHRAHLAARNRQILVRDARL